MPTFQPGGRFVGGISCGLFMAAWYNYCCSTITGCDRWTQGQGHPEIISLWALWAECSLGGHLYGHPSFYWIWFIREGHVKCLLVSKQTWQRIDKCLDKWVLGNKLFFLPRMFPVFNGGHFFLSVWLSEVVMHQPHKGHISFKLDHVTQIKSTQLLNKVQLCVHLYFSLSTRGDFDEDCGMSLPCSVSQMPLVYLNDSARCLIDVFIFLTFILNLGCMCTGMRGVSKNGNC